MSVVGVSPTDLVNGVIAARRIIDALKDENGSGERVAEAYTSIEHDLAALETLENALETLSHQDPSGANETRKRLQHLRELQTSRLARLLKYDIRSTRATTWKQKTKRGFKKLAWEFGGQRELAESNARHASASSALHLDAIVLTGKCTQAEVAKLEPLISRQLDTIKEQHQAARSASAAATQQILDCISRSQHDLSSLVQAMQIAFETKAESSGLAADEAQRAPLTIVHAPAPRLNTRIDRRGSMSSWDRLPASSREQLRVLPEPLITPILIAILARLAMPHRIDNMLQNLLMLAKNDPAAAALIFCILLTFSRMTVWLGPRLSLLGADRVTFHDAFGSSHTLPFSTCEHPSTFSGFMEQHFFDHPWQSYILTGHFHLNLDNSRGQLVTQQTWGSFIRPNAIIAMSMFLELRQKICIRCARKLIDDGRDLFCVACKLFHAYAFTSNDMDDDERSKRVSREDDPNSSITDLIRMIRNLHAFLSESEIGQDQEAESASEAKTPSAELAAPSQESRQTSRTLVHGSTREGTANGPRHMRDWWYCDRCNNLNNAALSSGRCSVCGHMKCRSCRSI